MKKSIRLLLATAILIVAAVGAAAPVKSTTVLSGISGNPVCGPDTCMPNSN